MFSTRRRILFGGIVTTLAAIIVASPVAAHATDTDPVTVDQLTFADGQVSQRTPVTVHPQVNQFRPASAPAAAPARPAAVSKRLAAMAAATPGARVRVTVTLRNDQPVPRFPSLAPGESLTSPKGTAALASAHQLVEQVKAGHAADYAAWRDRIAALGGQVVKDFWLFKGFTADVPLGAVPQIAANPQVQYVEPAANPNPLPADTDAGNDVVVARTLLGSEPYRQFARSTDRIALVDSGVNGHVLNNGVIGSIFDDSGESPISGADSCNHGTRSVAALAGNSSLTDQFRGVTSMKVNVYKFTDAKCTATTDTAADAIQHAVSNLEKVIVLEIQFKEGPDSSVSTAADDAFDAGAVVIGASGNFGQGANTVAAPGNAHKVIAMGAVDVKTFALQPYVGQGPTIDGRVKPDLVGPTNFETADGSSSTAMSIFTGTSGATAVSGGTGAALWSFLRGSNATVDPGFVHAGMIAGGSHPYPFDSTEGAGKFKLSAGGIYIPFTATVHDGEQITLPFNLAATSCRLSVSLWWPESVNSDHNDVDLHIFNPSGTQVAESDNSDSIWEFARISGGIAGGTWKFQVKGYHVRTGSQKVYGAITTCR